MPYKSSPSLLMQIREAFQKETKPRPEVRFNPEEKKILSNALTLKNTAVHDIMTPRGDIVWLSKESSYDQIMELIQKTPHHRFPVCQGKLDQILGYIGLKDILIISCTQKKFSLKPHLKKVLFVPASMKCLNLLLKMRQEKTFFAMVIDEYGSVDGLVTLTDIVENIVGDVDEVEEHAAEAKFTLGEDGVVLTDGRVAIDTLSEETGLLLTTKTTDDEEIETIGGLVLHLVGHVPVKGEIVQHPSGYTMEILEATPRTVKRIKIHPSHRS